MPPATEVVGIDHIYLSASDMEQSIAFYDVVLASTLGFAKQEFQLNGAPHVQYFNRHFGIVVRPAAEGATHDPGAPGLHHLCLRVDSSDDVQATAGALQRAGIAATDARLYTEYASDYVATYFSDPDGTRLEITNYRQERRERHDRWGAA